MASKQIEPAAGRPPARRKAARTRASSFNPNDWDAKYNYEYVAKLQKDLAASVEENVKMLQESELPPTEALPPEQVG